MKEQDSFVKVDYMEKSKNLTEKMREKLVSWMVEIQPHLKIKQETLFLAVFIVDKFCSNNFIELDNYQLLGITSIFVAAKY